MKTNRYYHSFFITLVLFISPIFGISLLFQDKPTYAKEISKNEQRVSFTIIAQKSAPAEEKPKEKIDPTPPKKEMPQKPLTKPPKEKLKEQQKPKNEPVQTKTQDTKQAKTTIEKQVSQATMVDTNDIKAEFLKNIKIQIDKNKVYPQRAISRGIQGIVDVNFTLLKNGTISNINIHGHNIFKNSVEDALHKSFPVPVPPELNEFPMSVSFKVAFNLK